MSVNLSPIGNGFQFLTATGLPLAGGKIYTYQAGSSTPLATYSDNGGIYANANPIVLGADGRPASEIWLTYGYNYKFILTDANDVQIQSYDNLYGIIGTAPSSGATIPAGLISLWSGAVGSVPSGWYLCDGSNGTPDLRDRFLVGAGSTYSVGATGGAADAIVVSHNHTATSITSISDPGHEHYIAVPTNGGPSITPNLSSSNYMAYQNAGGGSAEHYALRGVGTTASVGKTSGSSTGVSASTSTTNSSAGVSGTNANLPPYYALAYIMKS